MRKPSPDEGEMEEFRKKGVEGVKGKNRRENT